MDDTEWQDALEADIADPARIASHERCLEIMEALSDDIAGIKMRLEQHAIRYSVDEPSRASVDWKHRATYAMHRMTSELKTIARRDREIRSANDATFQVEHSLNAMFKKVAFSHLSQAQYSEWLAEAKALRASVLAAQVAAGAA